MNKKLLLISIPLIIILIIIIFMSIWFTTPQIQEPSGFTFNKNGEGFVRLEVGESIVFGGWDREGRNMTIKTNITMNTINSNSVIVHDYYRGTVECHGYDTDKEITLKGSINSGRGMVISLFKIEQNSAILKLKSYPSFC